MASIVDYRLKLLERLGVPVHLNTEVTPELLMELHPDVVVLATGSAAIVPPIPGIDGPGVHLCDHVLNGEVLAGKRIAVLGGGLIGCEVADYLASQGKEVTVIDVIAELAVSLNSSRRSLMLKRMNELPIAFMLERRMERINLPNITVSGPNGEETLTGFDHLVIAAGRKAVSPLREFVEQMPCVQMVIIGDASGSGLALDAIHQAAQAACDLAL